jgi:hypothetical protein
MKIPLVALNNISKMVKTVADFLAANPGILKTLENDQPAPEVGQTNADSRDDSRGRLR